MNAEDVLNLRMIEFGYDKPFTVDKVFTVGELSEEHFQVVDKDSLLSLATIPLAPQLEVLENFKSTDTSDRVFRYFISIGAASRFYRDKYAFYHYIKTQEQAMLGGLT